MDVDFVLRAILINPVLIALSLAIAFCASKSGMVHLDLATIALAAVSCLIAAEISLMPMLLARRGSQARRVSQADVAQAALLGTVIHLLISAGIGLGVSAWLRPGSSFMYWLLLFYWMTLITISVLSVRAVKTAPITPTGAESPVS